MKKLLFIAFGIAIGMGFLFSSCKKSSDTPAVNASSLKLNTAAGYISTNQSVNLSSPLLFGVIATGGDYSLNRLFITRTVRNKTNVVKDSSFLLKNLNYDIAAASIPFADNETWVFKVYNSNHDSLGITIIITTVNPPPAGPINTWPTKVLGAQISTFGHFAASSSGNVYSLTDAKTNAAYVDFVYFWDPASFANLASPADADAKSAYNDPGEGIATWPVQNATLFKKVTDPINWTEITNDSMILVQTQSGVTLSKLTGVAKGDYYSFITAGGKKGLLQISALTPEATGTVTIDIKVQQ